MERNKDPDLRETQAQRKEGDVSQAEKQSPETRSEPAPGPLTGGDVCPSGIEKGAKGRTVNIFPFKAGKEVGVAVLPCSRTCRMGAPGRYGQSRGERRRERASSPNPQTASKGQAPYGQKQEPHGGWALSRQPVDPSDRWERGKEGGRGGGGDKDDKEQDCPHPSWPWPGPPPHTHTQ